MYSIQSNVSFTLGYLLPNTLPIYYLPKRLLIDFLLAFGLAFGVNLVIVPVTSRTVFLVFPLDLTLIVALVSSILKRRLWSTKSSQ